MKNYALIHDEWGLMTQLYMNSPNKNIAETERQTQTINAREDTI
jgi:hypothetical protein